MHLLEYNYISSRLYLNEWLLIYFLACFSGCFIFRKLQQDSYLDEVANWTGGCDAAFTFWLFMKDFKLVCLIFTCHVRCYLFFLLCLFFRCAVKFSSLVL